MTGIKYVHPGTVIGAVEVAKLGALRTSTNAVTVAAVKALLSDCDAHLASQPYAMVHVNALFHPGPNDATYKKLDAAVASVKGAVAATPVVDQTQNYVTHDSELCYKFALAYLITKQPKYADKVMQLLEAWSDVCQSWGNINENGPLLAGWMLVNMAEAAEILKHQYPQWSLAVETKFRHFVDTILFPQFNHSLDANHNLTGFVSKGNWGATIIEARLSYAIFTENDAEFSKCVQETSRLFDNLLISSTGQEVETLRDITHACMGIGSLVGISEILWHQGIDTYSLKSNLLLTALEYHASIIQGTIPADILPTVKNNAVWKACVMYSAVANWEIAYNHFTVRKLLKMPKTQALIESHRPEGYGFHWGLGTLTHFCTK